MLNDLSDNAETRYQVHRDSGLTKYTPVAFEVGVLHGTSVAELNINRTLIGATNSTQFTMPKKELGECIQALVKAYVAISD